MKAAVGSVAAWLSLFVITACIKEKSRPREPLDVPKTRQSSRQNEPESAALASSDPGKQLPPAPPPPPPPDPCLALPKLDPDQPVYLPGKGVVLTRLLKTCSTYDGRRGIEKDSPWLAMGFPCTAGGGRVDLKGNAYAPKMVSFVVSTDCPMTANSKDAIKKAFVDALGLPAESNLIAINPFTVHFWEIPGMPDADTGFTIELRSAPATEGAWKRIREKDKLRVRLFGRENAWVRGDHFYLVEADLYLVGTSQFGLELVSVKPLSKDETEAVKSRCQSLRTARNCSEIF